MYFKLINLCQSYNTRAKVFSSFDNESINFSVYVYNGNIQIFATKRQQKSWIIKLWHTLTADKITIKIIFL